MSGVEVAAAIAAMSEAGAAAAAGAGAAGAGAAGAGLGAGALAATEAGALGAGALGAESAAALTPEMLAAMGEAGAPGAASWAAGAAPEIASGAAPEVAQGSSFADSLAKAGNGAKSFLFGSPGGSQMTAQTAQALAGGQAAPLFGQGASTGFSGGGGLLGQFGATPAQSGLLSMGAGPTSMGGIAAEMGAPVASGASVQPYAAQNGLLSGMNWQKAGMNMAKTMGQSMSQPQQRSGGGAMPGPYQGQSQPIAPQNTDAAYRQKRDALLRKMLGYHG